jgi:hypothetical protein
MLEASPYDIVSLRDPEAASRLMVAQRGGHYWWRQVGPYGVQTDEQQLTEDTWGRFTREVWDFCRDAYKDAYPQVKLNFLRKVAEARAHDQLRESEATEWNDTISQYLGAVPHG